MNPVKNKSDATVCGLYSMCRGIPSFKHTVTYRRSIMNNQNNNQNNQNQQNPQNKKNQNAQNKNQQNPQNKQNRQENF